MQRWFFPFYYDLDVKAINAVVAFAASCHVQLVPVALVLSSPTAKNHKIRLEHIQQAKDFFFVMQCASARHHLEIEPHEYITRDLLTSLKQLPQELHCEGTLLLVSANQGFFLPLDIIQNVMHEQTINPIVLQIPTPQQIKKWHGPRIIFLPWRQTPEPAFIAAATVTTTDVELPLDSFIEKNVSVQPQLN